MSEILVKQIIKKFKKGDFIFKENEFGIEMYIIKSGKVQVSKKVNDKEIILEVLTKREFFGEMALFSDKIRTATAVALEDTEVIVITKNMLDSQLRNVPPWFVTMFKAIVRRLEKADKRIAN